MTFFIVPVLVVEDVSATSMVKRSGETFKDTWGETPGAGFGITAIVIGIGLGLVVGAILVSIPVAALLPGAGLVILVVLVAVALVFTSMLSQTRRGIAKTGLYLYAVEERTLEQFDNFGVETLAGRAEKRASPGSGSDPAAGD
jgi:hypothetical protein